MIKAKKYDWKDSNLALFGSDTEKQVKKESAESEPAWKGAGEAVGIEVWRINKFKVEHWPKEQYGEFFSGDSYIILNTYKNEGEEDLEYDVHFWIGKYSTQDEYGTAAYKTVELDTLLDDKPVQHREVGGSESRLFKTYFPEMVIMKGGCDTGFKRVVPEEYPRRLLRLKKEGRSVVIKEMPLKKGSYNDGDVFILDCGLDIYQINGPQCNKDEKFRALQHIQSIRSNRNGKASLADTIEGAPFDHPQIGGYFVDKERKEKETVEWSGNKLLRVVVEAESEVVAEGGDITLDMFDPADVFIFDTEHECFVWIGKEASIDERKNALPYACNYLSKTDHCTHPVCVVAQGKEPRDFTALF